MGGEQLSSSMIETQWDRRSFEAFEVRRPYFGNAQSDTQQSGAVEIESRPVLSCFAAPSNECQR